MATTLAVNQIKCILGWDFEQTLTMGNSSNINTHSVSTSLAQGTGAAGTADLLYSTSVTIAASGNTTFDLAGSLTDFFGNTITMARVKCLLVENNTTTTASSIAVGNGSNPFINWISPSTGTITVRNGGALFLFCTDATGYAVTAATGDILKVLNNDGSNSATVHITIIGSTV